MSQTIEHIGSHEAHESKRGHMRAGVYRGKGRVVVESVPIPEIGEGELLFRLSALVPTVVIPVALTGALLALYVLGMSINVFTMFAMVLAIGPS